MNSNSFYVYGHFDKIGNCFYIGKGIDDRAWRKEKGARNWYWDIYVEKYLNGEYDIKILHDDLSSEEAESIEGELILEYGYENLVNIDAPFFSMKLNEDLSLSINVPKTGDNHEIISKFHTLRSQNRKLIDKTKIVEKNNKEVETLKHKIKREFGEREYVIGERDAIDRLTICLCKLGRKEEAKVEADNYFTAYPDDMRYVEYERIMKRVNKQ